MVQKNVTVIQGSPGPTTLAYPTSAGATSSTFVSIERISIPEPVAASSVSSVKPVATVSDAPTPPPLQSGIRSLFTQTGIMSDQFAFQNTPVTTDINGNLYWIVKQADIQIRLGKYTAATGVVETTVVGLPSDTRTDTHNVGAIGVDANGFIHAIFCGHNWDLDYWKSNTAYSVTGGFTKYPVVNGKTSNGLWAGYGNGAERAQMTTYPHITYDNNLNLLFTMRMASSLTGFNDGGRGLSLQKYNAGAGTWTSLGGLSYSPSAPAGAPNGNAPLLVWSEHDVVGGGYQPFATLVITDKTNRIHAAGIWHKNGMTQAAGGHAAHLWYMYSDDGVVWKRADGSVISTLPVIPENEAAPGPFFAGYVPSLVARYSRVRPCGADSQGRPVVKYYNNHSPGNETYFIRWENGAWVETQLPWTYGAYTMPFTDNDVWFGVQAPAFRRSITDGASWQTTNFSNKNRGNYFCHRASKFESRIIGAFTTNQPHISGWEFISWVP